MMKRYLAGITMLFLLGTFSWGQGIKESFDFKKSREELEIMKGILNTTLTFFTQNSQKQSSRWRFSNLDAFYLTGQGAVFVMFSVPNVSYSLGPEFSERMALLNGGIRDLTRSVQEQALKSAQDGLAASYAAGSGVGAGIGGGVGGTVAPVPPAPPTPPAPPVPPSSVQKELDFEKQRRELEVEKLRQFREETQARYKSLREEQQANRQKLLQYIAEVKAHLIEALANYADSITTVKPEEYINVVLVTDGFDDQKTRSDVISARKSWITDYKAGRLNLEGFKQKVIQYTE